MQISRFRLPAALGLALAMAWPLIVAMPAVAQREPRGEVEPSPVPEQRRAPRGEREKAPGKDGKSAEATPPKPIPKTMRPPGGSAVPAGGAERAKLLAELYAYLATAEDETIATRITGAIEHVWQAGGGDTVHLLMERSRRAEADKKPELAMRLLDRAVQLAPDYPEVFNRRAALHFGQNNVRASIGDLRRVLALEPNHFKALEALASIFKDLGQKKAALEVYRKLYEVHPMSGVKSTFEELEREVAGQAG